MMIKMTMMAGIWKNTKCTVFRQQIPNGKAWRKNETNFSMHLELDLLKSWSLGRKLIGGTDSLWLSVKCKSQQTDKLAKIHWQTKLRHHCFSRFSNWSKPELFLSIALLEIIIVSSVRKSCHFSIAHYRNSSAASEKSDILFTIKKVHHMLQWTDHAE
jgi:hypothetical protein